MANVTVEIDTLKNGGKYVQTVYNNIEQSHASIKSLSINVTSFKSFKIFILLFKSLKLSDFIKTFPLNQLMISLLLLSYIKYRLKSIKQL